jgi:hypothetical protein
MFYYINISLQYNIIINIIFINFKIIMNNCNE